MLRQDFLLDMVEFPQKVPNSVVRYAVVGRLLAGAFIIREY